MTKQGDPYQFGFWIQWILWFAGSLIIAALFWTQTLTWIFGSIQGPELTVAWAVAVFGSWFILVIPFMRKKERIWKRLNQDQEKAVDAWLLGMGGFIGILILSAFAWSFVYRSEITDNGLNRGWLKAVLVTWLVAMLPFLIVMYKKADQIFRQATIRQTEKPSLRSILVPREDRLLRDAVVQKIKSIEPALQDGHVVDVILNSGERVPRVFVLKEREILGIYDQEQMNFTALDVIDVEAVDSAGMNYFDASKWLRLDGRI